MVKKEETVQLTKHTKKNNKYNTIVAVDGPRGNYQMDIIIFGASTASPFTHPYQ